MPPAPVTLTFDLENGVRVTCANFSLDLSVLDLGPIYATDRQTDVRQHHRLKPPPIRGGGNLSYR